MFKHGTIIQIPAAGLEPLTALIRLDVSWNDLPSLHQLATCRGAPLLGELDARSNPLCQCLSSRLHLVYLLPQVCVHDCACVCVCVCGDGRAHL